jgi:hypothetical protein
LNLEYGGLVFGHGKGSLCEKNPDRTCAQSGWVGMIISG